MVRWFFLFIHFLAVEDYEFVKSKSHIISGPLTQKCIRILSWSISLFFFYFNCSPDDVLCKIAIWADDTALNSSCDKPSDLLQQVKVPAVPEISENAILHRIIFWYLGNYSIFIHIGLKPRILIASFLLAPLLNN